MTDNTMIPEHWDFKNLGELCEIVSGNTPKGLEQVSNMGEYQFYKVSDMNLFGNEMSMTTSNLRLTTKEIKNLRIKVYPKGTVIFPKRGGAILTNKKRILSKASSFDLNVMGILPNKNVESSFLYYWFLKLDLTKIFDGSNVPQINNKNVAPLKFPLPPVKEQQQIVSKIEELFSEVDKGIEEIKTAQQQLKVYRQAVLKWAFEGKLTNKDVKEGELPKGWEWIKSGYFFDFVTSGSRGWAKYYSDKGAIFIRITNLDFDSLELDLNQNKIQYVNPPSGSEGIRTKIQEGDFLFSITGYLGMLAIAPKLENAYINQHVCLCRPKDNFIKKYLGYWIISKSGGHHYLNKNQKGAVKAGLNLEDLKTFPVPLCSIKEQQEIVQEIESRLSVCDKIEETITNSLKQAEALRQSILKKAFEGKLT